MTDEYWVSTSVAAPRKSGREVEIKGKRSDRRTTLRNGRPVGSQFQ